MFSNGCWHKWDKWQQEQVVVKKEYSYSKPDFTLIQSRTCLRCNFKEIKTHVVD